MKAIAPRLTPFFSVPVLLGFAVPTSPGSDAGDEDLRTYYDVQAYDLELAVRPNTKTLEGVVRVTGTVTAESLESFVLDLEDLHEVLGVKAANGTPLSFRHEDHALSITFAEPVPRGGEVEARIHYRGQPRGGSFDGFHWARSGEGKPWINTSCQGIGAHYWYPCKASYFHPDDKPERVSMAITCPADLVGVSNGRLIETVEGAPEWLQPAESGAWKTYRWRHDYPLETYSVTLNVGPYVSVTDELALPGLDQAVPFVYYVLPENAEKAALQFQQVPELLKIFSEAFGPYPFPDSKFALVETNFWGMEHSTAIAYGSSYPAWCEEKGIRDPHADRNKWFDYILVHEVAHEWWGNSVSAEDWGHFWIHEGMGSYAEGVYVEMTRGREAADAYFVEVAKRVPRTGDRLYRGDHPDAGEAYDALLYDKGSVVMNAARHYIDNDPTWWRVLRTFQSKFRYGNATSEDFRDVLAQETRRSWDRFFQDWVYGEGLPGLKIRFTSDETGTYAEVENVRGQFHVPLDLVWTERRKRRVRFWVEPGEHRFRIPCSLPPADLAPIWLERLPGDHTFDRAQDYGRIREQ